MDIMKWDPFRDMVSMRDEIDRLFDGFIGRLPGRREVVEGAWIPLLDLEETKDDFIIRAEIPGMKKEDVKISLTGDKLRISGERSREKEEKGKTYHRMERAYGRFERVLTLPAEIDASKVKASYKEGLLEVTLPKTERVKPKEIGIDIK
jgi:HSP20 family protein